MRKSILWSLLLIIATGQLFAQQTVFQQRYFRSEVAKYPLASESKVQKRTLRPSLITPVNPGDTITLDLNNPANPSSFAYTEKGYWDQTYNDADFTYFESQIFAFSHLVAGEGAAFGGFYWDGFTACNSGDTVNHGNGGSTGWVDNQWGCMAGGGIQTNDQGRVMTDANGKVAVQKGLPYLVAFWGYHMEPEWWHIHYGDVPSEPMHCFQTIFNDGKTYEAIGVYVNNHPWSYYGNLYGDGFARVLDQEGDYFKLIIHGLDADGAETGTSVEYMLAEYKNGQLIQSDQWEWIDLSSLGEIGGFYYTMETTDAGMWGPNTAMYFCMDKLQVRVPVEEVQSRTRLVTSTAFTGEGSFTEACINAMDGDTIRIADAIKNDTIFLTTWANATLAGRYVVVEGNGITISSKNVAMGHSLDFRGSVELNDIHFVGVRANIDYAPSVVRRCSFVNAKSTPLYITPASEGTIRVENCRFSKNTPNENNQGVLYAFCPSNVPGYNLDVVSCSFVDNVGKSSKEATGGIAVGASAAKVDVRLFNNVFQNNMYSTAKKMMVIDAAAIHSAGYNRIGGEVTAAVAEALTITDQQGTELGDMLVWSNELSEYVVQEGSRAYRSLPENTVIGELNLSAKDILSTPINYTAATHSGACQSIQALPVLSRTWLVTSAAMPPVQGPVEEGSLLYALEQALDGDTIEFASTLSNDTIYLKDAELDFANRSLTFKGNHITLHGGVYTFDEGGYSFSEVRFSQPQSIDVTNADWNATRCIFDGFNSKIRKALMIIENNKTAARADYKINFVSCLFSNNTGKNTGGIFVDNATEVVNNVLRQITTFSFLSCSFIANRGTVDGSCGALYFYQKPKVYIGNCAFDRSRQYAGGGMILGDFTSLGYNVFEGALNGQPAHATDKSEITFHKMYKYDAQSGEYLVRPNEALSYNLPPNPVIDGYTLPETDIMGNPIDYSQPSHTGAYQTLAVSKAVDGTLTVTNGNASGEGSFSQAIYDAFYGEKIVVSPTLKGKTVMLDNAFIYARELNIEGNGLILDGAHYSFSNVRYNFSDLTFRNFEVFYLGNSDFKAVRCVFDHNTNFTRTGAVDIFNSTLNNTYTFENCLFKNCYQQSSATGASAGAMSIHEVPDRKTATVNLISCTFADNQDDNYIREDQSSRRIAAAISIANTPKVNIFNTVFHNNISTKGAHTIYGAFNSLGYNVIEGSVSHEASLVASDSLVSMFGKTLMLDEDVYKVSDRGAAYYHLPANVLPAGITLPLKDLQGFTVDYTKVNHSGASQVAFINPLESYAHGVFFVNEDWFGHNNGTVNFLDANGNWHYSVYEQENPGKELGCTSQYGTIYGDKFFIVSKQEQDPGANVTGSRLVVCNAETMESLAEFTMVGDADGRSFLGVDEHKGYVGTSDGIYLFDVDNLSIGAKIKGTENGSGSLYSGQIGTMVRSADKVFAVNQQSGVMVIDATADTVQTVISAPKDGTSQRGFGSIVQSKDGNLWLSVAGSTSGSGSTQDYMLKMDPYTLDTTRVALPAGMSIPNSWYAWTADGFCSSTQTNKLYWKNDGGWFNSTAIYEYDIDTNDFRTIIDLSAYEPSEGWGIYGAGFRLDPATDDIYVSLFKGFGIPTYKVARINPATGVVTTSYPMKDNYWFPAMPVFPDNAAPVISGLSDISLAKDTVIYLGDMASDADNMSVAIVKTVLFTEDETLIKAYIAKDSLYISSLNTSEEAQQTNLTVQFNSNGKIVQQTISVNVAGKDNDTGIGQNQMTISRVYPTVTTGVVHIFIPEGVAETAQVVDLSGRTLQTIRLESVETTVDLGTYKPGLYFVRVGSQTIEIIKK